LIRAEGNLITPRLLIFLKTVVATLSTQYPDSRRLNSAVSTVVISLEEEERGFYQ